MMYNVHSLSLLVKQHGSGMWKMYRRRCLIIVTSTTSTSTTIMLEFHWLNHYSSLSPDPLSSLATALAFLMHSISSPLPHPSPPHLPLLLRLPSSHSSLAFHPHPHYLATSASISHHLTISPSLSRYLSLTISPPLSVSPPSYSSPLIFCPHPLSPPSSPPPLPPPPPPPSSLGDALRAYILSGRPFFGICIGMQVLFDGSTVFGVGEARGESG